MPLKTNEKFFWADRKNRLERARLDLFIKTLDRQKCSIALEIDREKSTIVKGFNRVRKTSGLSEEAVPSEGDTGYQTAETYVNGLRLSERRLLEWRQTEKQLEKFLDRAEWEKTFIFGSKGTERRRSRAMSAPTENHRQCMPSRLNSVYDDDVFEVVSKKEKLKSESTISIDPEDLEKKIFNEYSQMISSVHIPELTTEKNTTCKRRLTRPQTAHTVQMTAHRGKIQHRPYTAHSVGKKDNKSAGSVSKPRGQKCNVSKHRRNNTSVLLSSSSLSSSEEDSDLVDQYALPGKSSLSWSSDKSIGQTPNSTATQIADFVLNNPIPGHDMEKLSSASTSDQEMKQAIKEKVNNEISPLDMAAADMKSKSNVVFEETSAVSNKTNSTVSPRRSRHVSIGSYTTSEKTRGTSTASERSSFSRYGSVSDVFSLDSEGNRRPSKWREYVAASSAKIPESKRFLSIATVVKCALAFSKTARKQALNNLVTEQSMDFEDAIRRERLRKMHSKNNVLNAFAKMWAAQTEHHIEESPEC